MTTKAATMSRRRRPKAHAGKYRIPNQASLVEYYSRGIGRALEVLDCFKDGEMSLSLMDISKLRGFPESSVFRILLTLEAHGYLVRTADGSYRLAPRLLFGKLYDRAHTLRDLVHPFLQHLNCRFNESASMGFLFQDRIEVVDTLEAIQEIRRTNTLGRVLPPHCSSIGKAIVAFQEQPVIDRILRINGLHRRTEKTITDHVQLLNEYEEIRNKGFALDREESTPGGVCIGAPLYDERRHVVAAISLSVPLFRLSPERENEIIPAVIETARKSSEAIAAHAATLQPRT